MLRANLFCFVYAREREREAEIATVLTMDEARRTASNIAKLPQLLNEAARRDQAQ
jgi:hypothetical protein